MGSVGRSFANGKLRFGLPLLLSASVSAGAPPLSAADPGAVPAKTARPKRGPTIGLRTGWAFPLGERLSDEALSDSYVGLLPLWLDAGYRLSPRIYAGAYFQYGFLFVSSSLCQPPLESCRGHDLRGGINAHYYLLPRGPVDPWFGGGVGYEATTLTIDGAEQSASRTDAGIEFLLELGADFVITDRLRLGPFAAITIATYATETVENPGEPSKKYEISSSEDHHFLFLGVRVKYDL